LQDAKVKALERELEAQEKIVESIKKQREEFKASVREAERIRNLPTLGQVASGERFIGGRAGREARELGRIQTTEQRLTDRRQRLQEQLDAARAEPGGSTSGRAAAIEKQLQDVNEKLGEAAGRRGQLEDALRQRVADIGQSQLEQLQQINGELAEAKAALDEINQSLTEEATR
jgi:DNA mismatch repair ATPase MutS